MKKGDNIIIKIEKLVFGGEGLGYYDGFTFFVPMSVPGDEVEAEIISLKKDYGRALIKKIIKPSEDRIACMDKISFEDFQGCDYAMIKYNKQLEYKSSILLETIKKIGKINDEINFEGIIGADNITNYRNKVSEPFAKKGGKIITGFYQKKSHDVFEVENNMLRSKIADKVINELLEKLNEGDFTVYNEVNKSGFLRYLLVRNNSYNEVMITVVINKTTQLKKLRAVLLGLTEKYKEIVSMYISLKSDEGNYVLGNEHKLIHGSEYLEEELDGIRFKIYPDSFFQINSEQTVKLYNKAMEYLGDSEDKRIVDAFSGTGTLGMLVSKTARKVYCIESMESSVISAKHTAAENNIKNVRFKIGKVENKLPELLKNTKIDGIIFDPPRKGIDESTLKSIGKHGIERIVYISCNPSTLARDSKILTDLGYRLEKLAAVDMFPQTHHIEAVALLSKLK
ncbi:MAG: 23S rRNA (uracil(1939)-C(5))-methyltransferase RlmD [Fusobacteriales bacterium]|jgi:23S rRNA (uracil1939-C5)-methyltransferase|nr:23S rRNA (uracil(1939)-C(5))-methyltransferase RlmD [Fusobacteriales bacterium]